MTVELSKALEQQAQEKAQREPLLADQGMWRHCCPVERSLMAVGNDEECNWCGAKGGEST
jgi:hypothetical protein